MIREVDIPQLAAARRAGAFVPMRDVPARIGELPAGEPVYVICASGDRSKAAA